MESLVLIALTLTPTSLNLDLIANLIAVATFSRNVILNQSGIFWSAAMR